MSVTLVREAFDTLSSGTDLSVSFGALPAAGNLVVVFVSCYGQSVGTVTGVSDNQGNGAYSKAGEVTGYGVAKTGSSIWYKENIGSPSGTFTVTVDLPGTASNEAVVSIAEFSGIATTSVLRDAGTDSGDDTATDASVSTAGSAAQSGDLVVACAQAAISGSTDVHWGTNATTGYTSIRQYPNYAADASLSADYKAASAGGTQSAAWSHDACTGADNGWGAVIAVFAAAGGGGGPTIPVFMNQYRQRGN